MTTKCLPKRQDLKKINRKYHFSRHQKRKILGQKMKRTQVQPQRRWWRITRSQQKQGTRKFQSRWASLYTWLTYDKDKNKMYCSKCISIGANNTMTAGCDSFKTSSLTFGMQLVQITRFIASRIAQNCWKSFSGREPPYPGLMAHYFWWWWAKGPSSSKARVISVLVMNLPVPHVVYWTYYKLACATCGILNLLQTCLCHM